VPNVHIDTPVPPDDEPQRPRRTSELQRIVGLVTAFATILGGAVGGTAWYSQRPASEQGKDESDIAELKAANKALSATIESGKEKRIDGFEGRLGKIEKWQGRYGYMIDRIADETLGADEAKRVRRAATRAAETAEEER